MDLGTGTGRILELFSGRAQRLIGVDTNREMLKCARVRLDAAQLSNCSVRLSDIYDLPFPEAYADVTSSPSSAALPRQSQGSPRRSHSRVEASGTAPHVDFAPHDYEFLREDHAHVRLGFAAPEIESWMKECGVQPNSYRELRAEGTNEGLTVALWSGWKAEASQDFIPKSSRVTS